MPVIIPYQIQQPEVAIASPTVLPNQSKYYHQPMAVQAQPHGAPYALAVRPESLDSVLPEAAPYQKMKHSEKVLPKAFLESEQVSKH